MINVFHAFSGVDSQLMAEKRVWGENNVKLIGTMEVDVDAIISAALIHKNKEFHEMMDRDIDLDKAKSWLKERNIGYDFDKNKSKIDRMNKTKLKQLLIASLLTKNYGDISLANTTKIAEDIDLFIYSSPCFIKGTLISTEKGLIPIEEIKTGDMVLTHKNRYKKVITPMINYANHIYELNCMASPLLYVTGEHPFYVRKRYREWDSNRRCDVRKFEKPIWMKVKDLSKDYYVGTPINTIEKDFEWNGAHVKNQWGHEHVLKNEISQYLKNKKFWWLVGRFIGDGWVDRWDTSTGGIKICSANTKTKNTDDVEQCLKDLNISYSKEVCRTIAKFTIHKQEFKLFFRQFGHGASNKVIPQDVLNLPINLLESVLEGYWSADGCITKNGTYRATSVSKYLILTLAQAIHKVYQRPTSVYKTKKKPTHIIEGRVVNQKDTYIVSFKKDKRKQDNAFVEDGYIWCPIKNINLKEYEGEVYNFEVEEDNSYVVENVIVHNCQSFSLAGKQEGIHGVSGLLLECEKFIRINKPKVLMLENVKNLVGKKFKKDFDNWVAILDRLGYNSYWKVLNAKDFGVPQNRERVFCISVRKEDDKVGYTFPQGFALNRKLKDTLQDSVDEKYYYKNERANELIKMILEKYQNKTTPTIIPCDSTIYRPKELEVANCITARYDAGIQKKGSIGVAIIEPLVAETRCDEGVRLFKDNMCGTIRTISGGGDKVILEQKSNRLGGLFDDHKGKHQAGSIWDSEGLAPTLDTMQGGWRQPMIITEGHLMPSCHAASRVVNSQGISPTVMENHGLSITIYDNYAIRKLTPNECWTLMDFDQDAFDKVSKYISDSQLYKQAGNSIVVSCMEHIFRELKKEILK